jgi:RNA 3'-terminal phosphate cyclase (ATP)
MLTIDGAYGEGGGQILRTTLSLAAILNRPVRIKNIRAKRQNPGLAAQHLTAVKAAAAICQADLSGDTMGSTQLTFKPQKPPQSGVYEFDVAEARQGGSAGAATLVFQTVFLPLALAQGDSQLTLRGGTHVPWSPSFHYLRDVFLPMAANLGLRATLTLSAWGWYPAGGGEIKAQILGGVKADSAATTIFSERGALQKITGIAVASSLPAHIAQRIRNRAVNLLTEAKLSTAIEPQLARSVSPGAGIFLTAVYESGRAGFSALGEKGKPSERVAAEAVEALLAFHRHGAALDEHLTDQLILPAALSGLPLTLQAQRLSAHTLTNLWVVEQFLGPVAQIEPEQHLIRFLGK